MSRLPCRFYSTGSPGRHSENRSAPFARQVVSIDRVQGIVVNDRQPPLCRLLDAIQDHQTGMWGPVPLKAGERPFAHGPVHVVSSKRA